MTDKVGARDVPSPGSSPSGQAPAGLAGSAATIPRAGDWVVTASHSYGGFHRFEWGQVDAVKTKTAYVKEGFGRRLRRVSLSEIIPCVSEQAAKHLCQRMDGVKGETMRRQRAAMDAYKQTIGRLYAQAMSARSGETIGLAPKDASAVPQGCAQEKGHD